MLDRFLINSTNFRTLIRDNSSTIIKIIVLIILILLPPLTSSGLAGILTKCLIYAIFALSLNLLCGYTGLFSLGHAAYFGLAAYTSGILLAHLNIESFWLVALAGILIATIAAAIFGLIVLRLSGIYFILVTLAIGQLISNIANKWSSVTGGTNGLLFYSYPDLGLSWLKMNDLSFYYLVLIVFIICFILLNRLVTSPFGTAIQGISTSEVRMRNLGYNTNLYKYIVFCIAGAFAGVAGVLFKYSTPVLVPANIALQTSTLCLLMVIIGGDQIFWGPVVGAFVITFIEYYSRMFSPERWPLILGIVFVLTVMFLRGGISPHLIRLKKKIEAMIWKY